MAFLQKWRAAWRGLCALLVFMSTASCFHLNYSTGRGRGPVHHAGTHNFFLWGLAGRPVLDVAAVCPEGLARMDVYQSFGDGFLRFITLGIYAPRSYDIWCAKSEGPVRP